MAYSEGVGPWQKSVFAIGKITKTKFSNFASVTPTLINSKNATEYNFMVIVSLKNTAQNELLELSYIYTHMHWIQNINVYQCPKYVQVLHSGCE